MEQTIPPAESSIVEFKREWTETARETFCAFLNSHGGRVYFGVSDDSSIVGIDKPDEISRTVHSIFKFAIHPSAESYVQTETLKIKDKNVVMVTVLEGSEPPYYVTIKDNNKKDGFVIYVRVQVLMRLMTKKSEVCIGRATQYRTSREPLPIKI